MKSETIHPVSAVAGAGLLGLVLLAAAAAQTPVTLQQIPTGQSGQLRVAGIPTPQQMKRVVEGQPFTVPPGSLFVVTGLGQTQILTGSSANLRFDGQVALTCVFSSGLPPLGVVPPGLVAPGGTLISVETPGGGATALVLGYLVDA
ncbi:MAG TPA: hypothetical protein VF530_21595 [Planctomycetota bacterium]